MIAFSVFFLELRLTELPLVRSDFTVIGGRVGVRRLASCGDVVTVMSSSRSCTQSIASGAIISINRFNHPRWYITLFPLYCALGSVYY